MFSCDSSTPLGLPVVPIYHNYHTIHIEYIEAYDMINLLNLNINNSDLLIYLSTQLPT